MKSCYSTIIKPANNTVHISLIAIVFLESNAFLDKVFLLEGYYKKE